MSEHMSFVSKSCFIYIRDFRQIRNSLDSTIQLNYRYISVIHYNVDYYNSLFFNLPRSQLILNSAARAISKTPQFTNISPGLKSLHWLNIDQRIHYKILSITYKTLQSSKPSYLHNALHIQTNTCTRSPTVYHCHC